MILIALVSSMISQAQSIATFNLGGYEVEVLGGQGAFDLSIENLKTEGQIYEATIRLDADRPAAPQEFSLRWSIPSNGVHGFWSTASGFNKTILADWGPSTVNSKLARHAPVMSLLNSQGENKMTFAVSEAQRTVELTSAVREEDGRIYCGVRFFTERNDDISEYAVKIRLDDRAVAITQTLEGVANWWATMDGMAPAQVPEAARLPMYSTWYSYHQLITSKDLIKECKVAKQMGYESIIVDDGWQTMDSNRGYAYTGDWIPERIPEMKQLVRDVHDLDMKFLLWYGVPLVGEKSEAYKKFKGKYLKYWKGQGAYYLDPRYPEVREHIVNTYKKALKEWKLDGFKLDFLGTLRAYSDTDLTSAGGRDFASVNEAVDRLMTDVMSELKAINPDIMIEFRQPYIGPLMRKYGNIFRAGDCPNSIIENRVRTTDLRLLSGNTAVHSDMLMWQYEEPTELAALQLLNVLFAVPQLSVRLADIPEDHVKMVKYYNDYWIRNQSTLLDGEFEITAPFANYPQLRSVSKDKMIVALYEDQVVLLDKPKVSKLDVVNAKLSKWVVLQMNVAWGDLSFTIKDCKGTIVEKGNLSGKPGPVSLKVPVSGMLSITRNDK